MNNETRGALLDVGVICPFCGSIMDRDKQAATVTCPKPGCIEFGKTWGYEPPIVTLYRGEPGK